MASARGVLIRVPPRPASDAFGLSCFGVSAGIGTMGRRRGDIRILIADDERLFREALRALLETEPGFSVVGGASDGAEALKLVRRLKPDVLLLDLAMPRLPGLDALRTLAESCTGVRTLVLTAATRREEVVAALQLGARGVVLKDAEPAILFSSIRAVFEGGYWFGDEAIRDLVEALRAMLPPSSATPTPRPFNLTKRELDVIKGVVAGYSNKEIALRLRLSEDTVKHHLTSIFDKVGASNRLELALFAIHHQLA
jgi:two-component system, NarL family, nitrate/nitrite response regulator NarL